MYTEATRIVIKLGTAVLMGSSDEMLLSRFHSFIESIARLKKAGKEVLVVSSGAVGLGVQKLKLKQRPQELVMKQVCAAVGQGHLMSLYTEAFDVHGITTAQVLLTEEDFSNRVRYLNLRNALQRILEVGALPIINENDTVSTVELESPLSDPSHFKVSFGDNDKLAALVASKIDADLLIILTDVEGLYSADPRVKKDAKLIPLVKEITPEIEQLANTDATAVGARVGRGGIRTKLEAAKIAVSSGCAAVIASGKVPGTIDRLFSGEQVGTLFLPQESLPGKRRWIAYATTIKAAVVVNEGAQNALCKKKASLLAAGVIEVRGKFEQGEVISILNASGQEFARGMANYSSTDAKKICGMKSEKIDELLENRSQDALITRNNIAFLDR